VGTSTRNLMKQERVYERGARVVTWIGQIESACSAIRLSSFAVSHRFRSLVAIREKSARVAALSIAAELPLVVVLTSAEYRPASARFDNLAAQSRT